MNAGCNTSTETGAKRRIRTAAAVPRCPCPAKQTLYNTILRYKLTSAKPVNKLPALHVTQGFIIMFKTSPQKMCHEPDESNLHFNVQRSTTQQRGVWFTKARPTRPTLFYHPESDHK